MPEELVFAETDAEYPVTKEINYQGILISVRPQDKEEGDGLVIERVISSNPNLFLRTDLAPGTIIKLTDQILTSGM